MIKSGVLLHFDVEFTHPVPGIGQPMEFGFVAQAAEFHDNGHIEATDTVREMHMRWPVTQGARVTSWVAENQAELLAACRKLTQNGLIPQRQRDELVLWLRALRADFGDHIVPCGWTLGSDVAYLLWALGEDCHLVHYDALDVTSLAFGVFGRNLSDAELRAHFGIERPADSHHALVDARHQAVLLAAVRALAVVRAARA